MMDQHSIIMIKPPPKSSISSDSQFIQQTETLSTGLSLHIKNHPASSIIPSSPSSTSSSIPSTSQDDASFQQEETMHTEISKRDHDTFSESPNNIETQTSPQITES
jgi:hypothetical protein